MRSMKKQDAVVRFVSALILVLLIACAVDLVRHGAHTGGVLAIFSPAWFAGIAIFFVFALVVGVLLIWGLINPQSMYKKVLNQRCGEVRTLTWVGIACTSLLPAVLLLSPAGMYLNGFYYRLLALSLCSFIIAALLPSDRYPFWKRFTAGGILAAAVYGIALRLALVTDYPFKLGWSEGNRLWDYSLYFTRDHYTVVGGFEYPSYLAPGRHGLWGLPFLLPNVTIAAVRFWDALLWFVPSLMLGYAFFWPVRKWTDNLKLGSLVLLTFLFINQGPIYAPLLISATVIAFGVHPEKPVRSLLLTALACFYAGMSRWTWFVAPALWSGLVCLLEAGPQKDQQWWQRAARPVVYGLAGLGGGFLSLAVSGNSLLQSGENSSIAYSQPLLWYRLFPNATYPLGVLPATLIAVGPLVGLLLWALLSKRLRWDWLQWFGAAGVLLSTLIVGIVISVKIGGGSNLHNLDMFLLSLLFTVVSGFRIVATRTDEPESLPLLARVLVMSLVFIPAWALYRTGAPLQLPNEQTIRLALHDMNDIVYARANEGDVLFLDQRQLLTFGEIENVPLVMEHELKDLTNRAMAGNPDLFRDYYADLEAQRFSLIITGHLPTSYSPPRHPFSEEDNAQFEYIYQPMFEHYEVVRRFEEVGLWLLEPIQESE